MAKRGKRPRVVNDGWVVPTSVDQGDEPIEAPDAGGAREDGREPAGRPGGRDRLSVPLGADGRVDWANLRPSSKAKLETALGVRAGESPAGGGSPLDPGICAALYEGLSRVIVAIAAARQCSDAQIRALAIAPDERDALVPPTSAVLGKWIGPALDAYEAETRLAVVALMIVQAKIVAFRAAATEAPILHASSPMPS